MSEQLYAIKKDTLDSIKAHLRKSDIIFTNEYQQGVHSNGSNRWCDTYDALKQIIEELEKTIIINQTGK